MTSACVFFLSPKSFNKLPTTSATPPPIPTSTSSNIIVGTSIFAIDATLIAKLILDNSPPDKTF